MHTLARLLFVWWRRPDDCTICLPLGAGIVEAFAMGGRGVATVIVRPNASATGVSVFSGGNVTLRNLTVWGMETALLDD